MEKKSLPLVLIIVYESLKCHLESSFPPCAAMRGGFAARHFPETIEGSFRQVRSCVPLMASLRREPATGRFVFGTHLQDLKSLELEARQRIRIFGRISRLASRVTIIS